MMEFYAAYWTHHDLMDFTEPCCVTPPSTPPAGPADPYAGKPVDFWPAVRASPVRDSLVSTPGLTEPNPGRRRVLHRQISLKLGEEPPAGAGRAAVRPLRGGWSKKSSGSRPSSSTTRSRSRRWPAPPTATPSPSASELFITGREYANGFSSSTTPKTRPPASRPRLPTRTPATREAMFYDADFIRALGTACPPTGGCGIRLIGSSCH